MSMKRVDIFILTLSLTHSLYNRFNRTPDIIVTDCELLCICIYYVFVYITYNNYMYKV
jgi:hypothetical protein